MLRKGISILTLVAMLSLLYCSCEQGGMMEVKEPGGMTELTEPEGNEGLMELLDHAGRIEVVALAQGGQFDGPLPEERLARLAAAVRAHEIAHTCQIHDHPGCVDDRSSEACASHRAAVVQQENVIAERSALADDDDRSRGLAQERCDDGRPGAWQECERWKLKTGVQRVPDTGIGRVLADPCQQSSQRRRHRLLLDGRLDAPRHALASQIRFARDPVLDKLLCRALHLPDQRGFLV